MKKRTTLICSLLLGCSTLSYGQQDYNKPPYDGQEAWLREIPIEEMALDPLVINKDWVKRDSLTYLRFKDQETILLYGTDAIPEWIAKFKKLKLLCAMPTAVIKTIPNRIGEISELENFVLIESKVSSIPPSFTKLTKLKHLNLIGDGKCAFPKDVSFLKNIESLFLADFGEIPPEIFELVSLKRLYLYRSNISEIPPTIKKLVNLEELNLEGNPITELPNEVFTLPKLANISLTKDNIKDVGMRAKLNQQLLGSKDVQKERLRKLQDIERKKIFEKMRDEEKAKAKTPKYRKAYYEDNLN